MTIYFHNASAYDMVFCLRGALQYATQHKITYPRENGSSYTRPLLKDAPQVLFKNKHTPLTMTLRFSCIYENCECSLTDRERTEMAREGRSKPTCPFRRKIRFLDSVSQIQSSLEGIIDNHHLAATKENIPLHLAFPTTKAFCDSKNFTDQQFQTFCRTKCKMPFELCTDLETMQNITSPPPKEAFKSKLRCTDGISDEDHAIFTNMWRTLGCQSLVDIFGFYAIGDVTMYSDSMAFFLEKQYKLTHLYPSHFLTISSLAVSSLLFNARHPGNPRRRLSLPFLTEELYQLISQNQLTG